MGSARVAGLAVACVLLAAVAPAAAAAERRHAVGPQDAGTRVSLAQDELLVVELSARTSTGYSWQVEAIDGARLAAVDREHQSAPGLGGLDVERLLFKGVAAGGARLSLVYRRPWVAARPEDPRYAIDVDVAGPYAGGHATPPPQPRLAYAATGAHAAKYNVCDPGDGSYSRCTAPKDQGSSNACWAFATAAVFENVLQLRNPSGSYDLSEQYLISCDVDGYDSTNGGYEAFNMYIDRFRPPETAAGAVYERDFPYVGRDVSCGSSPHPHHEKLRSFTSLGQATVASVDALKAAIQAHGPVWVGVCADARMQRHDGSSIFRSSCSRANHAVVLVGWDDNGGDGYWYMRNSWGATWGDRGHLKIAYGAARIGERASYVVYDSDVNTPPVADAGTSRTVRTGASVTLDGSASSDRDGSIARYAWAQTSGSPTVTLRGAGAARATFVAPSSAARLAFTLTVTDDAGATGSDAVSVTVTGADGFNLPPVADPGTSQQATVRSVVHLDGSASRDADGTLARWAWTQTAGPHVALSGTSTAAATFTAPSSPATLEFELVVTDDEGATGRASVAVEVVDGSAPAPDPGATPLPTPRPPEAGGCTSTATGSGLGLGSLSVLAGLLAWPRRRARRGPRPGLPAGAT